MRVQLPSHGILGQKVVDLEIPRIADLVYMSTYNEDDNLHEYEIVRRLSDAEMDKITWFDCQYLYALIVMSLTNATLTHEVTCNKCGHKHETTVTFDQLEIEDLHTKDPWHKVTLNGEESYLNILSAKDMADCIDMAQYEDDEKVTLEHCKVAVIYGFDVSEWRKATEMTMSEYLTALTYERYMYHGFVCVNDYECPQCGHDVRYRFKMNPQFAKLDFDCVLDVYSHFMDTSMTLNDIMNMSYSELNSLIRLANKLVDNE